MFDVEKEEGNNKRNPLYNMEYKVIITRRKPRNKNILKIN